MSANLQSAILVNTDLTDADLTGCRVYGVSAWNLKLEGAKQENLIITPEGEPEITVDNIEVAQFIYLLLHNQKIRDVIDTIGKKAVLILGRFTDERKAVLDALRDLATTRYELLWHEPLSPLAHRRARQASSFATSAASARCGRCAWSIKAIMDEHAVAAHRGKSAVVARHRSRKQLLTG